VRSLRLIIAAALLGCVLAGSAAPANTEATRWRVLPGHLLMGAPAWYSPDRNPPLPLVLSPHARGGDPEKNARRWGDLPGRKGLIVLIPALKGRVLGETRAWGYPPAIAKLLDAPEAARRALPWLRWDADRVYAAGFSMGGQESLLALARRPDLFAAVAVADSVTDFVRRWSEFPLSPLTRAEQAKATLELGGTPAQVGWLYERRSPAQFARTIAFSGVPLQIWWNPHENVVVHQGTTQSAGFVRLLRRLNPDAPVEPVVHSRPHGHVFRSSASLPEIVDFLLAHRRKGPPAAGFSYRSWLPRARIWGWSFRSGDVGHGFWRIQDASTHGFQAWSSSWLVVTPPGMRPLRLSPGHVSVIFD
jgi:pimeloyl-ACP methyl ester carboxylesterase